MNKLFWSLTVYSLQRRKTTETQLEAVEAIKLGHQRCQKKD